MGTVPSAVFHPDGEITLHNLSMLNGEQGIYYLENPRISG